MARTLSILLLALLSAVPIRGQDAPADEVLLEVVSLGVGGLARASDWNGLLIEFQDQGASQREVVIEVQTRDIDGDSPRYQRTVTTNPGSGAERVWVYAYLQPADLDRPLTVSAYEAIPAPERAGETAGVRYTAGTLLGRITTAGRPVRSPKLAAMLVAGRQPAGLAGYGSRRTASDSWMARGHEVTDIASDLAPRSLPDRALGYIGIETIVWTSADPTRLTPARADALRDWVRQGGHLVVALPASPQIWFDQVRNPLAELLPRVDAQRSSAGVEPLRPLLTYDDNQEIPDSLIVFDLRARADAEPDEAWPILNDQAGRTVVSRRRVGLGCVTLVGFDAANRAIATRGMPGMRPFWHRVLGRMGLPRESAEEARLTVAQEQERLFDSDIADAIAKSEAVVLGVLAGFGAFGIYWLVAAPLSYALLARFGLKRHAWLVFVGCVAVFAGATWGGVTLLRPSSPEVQTVVFLDSAEGTTRHSARAFASVLIPRYGEASVRIGRDEPGELSAIAPWADPASDGSSVVSGNFPDVRGYAVSGRGPDRMEFPARSTVKTLRADWSGERQWSTLRAVDSSGRPGRLSLDAEGRIRGSVMHGLPGELEDTIVLVVPPQDRLSKRVGQADIAAVEVRRLPAGGWAAGSAIDLGAVFTPATETEAADARKRDLDFFRDLARSGAASSFGDVSIARASNQRDRLLAAALMTRMPPVLPGGSGERPIGLRRVTHGLDLGVWFSQPSVVVLGIVRLDAEMDLPLPVALRTGDRWDALRGEGLAVVRWVYTLEPSPPDAARETIDTGV